MAWIACPQCTHTFRAGPYHVQVCPACGYRAPADLAKTPLELPVQEGDKTVPVVEGVVGKPRRFMGFCFLSLITLGLYTLFWFGRVFQELDRQHGRKWHRGLYITHILCWALVYLLAVSEAYLVLQDIDLTDKGVLGQVGVAVAALAVGTVLWHIFMILQMGRLRGYRRAHGLSPGVGRWVFFWLTFLTLPALGVVALSFTPWAEDNLEDNARFLRLAGMMLLPFLVAVAMLNRTVARLWMRIYEERGAVLPEWAQKAGRDEAAAAPA